MQTSKPARRAQSGDRETFRRLVESEADRVYRIALGLVRDHHDAEEVVQETFLKAYRGLGRFRGEAAVSTWLYRITVNAAQDQLRRRGAWSRHRDPLDAAPEVAEQRPLGDPERSAVARQMRAHIDRAVLAIPERERMVFVLRHDAGLKLTEIAEVLGRAEGTVKSLLFRAVRRLRTALADHLEVKS